MPDSPTDRNPTGSPHTRREFIKNVLVKTAYAAPIVATFVVAEDSEAMLHGGKKKKHRKSKRGRHSNSSYRKISKVSRPSRPSSGSGIKYNKKKHG